MWSATNLKAFRMQYLVIYSLVLCNFLNFCARIVKVCLRIGIEEVYRWWVYKC